MKKITFESIRLLNFCGIRDASFQFHGQNVVISGANGRGKSTIARAITYVLFGTDLFGSTFDIKTYDSSHNIIPEIEHSAELALRVDDESYVLKRTLTDSWKDNSVKNTYRYSVNGEVSTAGEFKKVVDGICPEITFRLASSPTFFLSKPWAEQRRFLEGLVPSISAHSVTGGDKRFDIVAEALQKESIDKYVSHVKYRRNEVQKQLDEIPTKLSTLAKALPEEQDWQSLKSEKDKLQEEYDNLQRKLFDAKSGGAGALRKEGLRKRLDFAEKRKREMEKSVRGMACDMEEKHESDMINARTSHSKASSVVAELQSRMDGFTDTEIHLRQQVEDAKVQVKKLNERQDAIYARRWEWNDNDSFCPHCGQPLPVSDVERMKRESEQRFKDAKASDIKALQDDFSNIQREYTEANSLISQLDDERKTTTRQLVEAQKTLKEAASHLESVKEEKPKGYSVLLSEKEEYRQVVREIAGLEEQLLSPEDADDDTKQLIARLESEKNDIGARISELWEKIKPEDSYLSVSKLIEDVKADRKTYQEQLDDLNDKLDIALVYYERSCVILEEEVNKHFSYVKWSMFKTDLSGEKKPFCECHHDGVPYSSLNTSARINAGIDIANAIARYYDVSVPIILDNSESNLQPLYSLGQQIRLSVTPSEQLNIEVISEENEN